jgi:hypothetical protein
MWTEWTNMADAAVMLPAAILMSVWLLCNQRWPRALLWPALFCLGASLVAASKVAYVGWGMGCARLNFTGLSGHTLLASMVFPAVFYLLLESIQLRWRYLGLAIGLALGALIGYSRLVVRAHSMSEVVLAFGLGAALSLVFAVLDERRAYSWRSLWTLMAALSMMLALQMGALAPSQDLLTRVALRLSGHSAPYVRGHWSSEVCGF